MTLRLLKGNYWLMALTGRQNDAIQREYDRRRFDAIHKGQEKKALIYEKLPELAELDKAAATGVLDGVTGSLSGTKEALEHARQKLTVISLRRKELLSSIGLTEADLEPEYYCPDCKDTGYIRNKPCHCYYKLLSELLYEQSNLKELLSEQNFSRFREDYYSDDNSQSSLGLSPRDLALDAKRKCEAFVLDFDNSFTAGILLIGSAGVGKTFLSNCIAKELMDSGKSVVYLSAVELFETLQQYKFSRDELSGEKKRLLDTCDLLIIDDLGTELSNAFTVSELFNCLNERLLHKKPCVISTNLDIDSFRERYSERISSRIIGNYLFIKLEGEDLRQKIRRKSLHI